MKATTRKKLGLCLTFGAISLGGCQTSLPPIETVKRVELGRFMGDWYVIANIPTFIEKDAYNALEQYRLAADGSIETTFSFNKGGFEGERKTYRPRGFVRDTESNAVWGMQFLWPFKSDYRIGYIALDYGVTAVVREKRDYVWIMARRPQMPEAEYQKILAWLAAQGYDISKVKKVPQRWGKAPHG